MAARRLLAVVILVATACTSQSESTDSAEPATAWPATTTTTVVPDDRAEERSQMVDEQIAARGVSDPLVLEAMRTVPRHRFVPDEWLDQAYADHPLPIGHGQTISQPYIVALMSETLAVEPGAKVL